MQKKPDKKAEVKDATSKDGRKSVWFGGLQSLVDTYLPVFYQKGLIRDFYLWSTVYIESFENCFVLRTRKQHCAFGRYRMHHIPHCSILKTHPSDIDVHSQF